MDRLLSDSGSALSVESAAQLVVQENRKQVVKDLRGTEAVNYFDLLKLWYNSLFGTRRIDPRLLSCGSILLKN